MDFFYFLLFILIFLWWKSATVWLSLCSFHSAFVKHTLSCSSESTSPGIHIQMCFFVFFFFYATDKVWQKKKKRKTTTTTAFHVFVCDSGDVSGGDINRVTFIFPLNLEHGPLPCRIQNWSLTFPVVPSLAWSHFLSIWFLAPYATFLFPACRQQGVALLSPS